MENKSDYRAWLEEQVAKGTPMKEILDALAEEANAMEKEKAQRFSKYDGTLETEGEAFCTRICHYKITLNDMATIFAHFLCQNVPGYSKLCGEAETDPADTAKQHMKNHVNMTTAMVETADKPEENQLAALFNAAFKEITGLFEDENKSKASPQPAGKPFDPVRAFLQYNGL